MKNKFISWNENVFLLTVAVLAVLSLSNHDYLYILISFTILNIINGNIPRIFIPDHKDIGRLIRRLLYEIPLFIPVFFWKIPLGLNMAVFISCGCFAMIAGIYFFIRRRDYRLAISYDLLQFEKEESYFQYISKALQIFAAVLGEEVFFRGFLFEAVEYSLYMIPIGAVLFMIYHIGISQRNAFRVIDTVTQLCFGLLAGISVVLTHSIIPGIVGHMLYNSPYIIIEWRKIQIKKGKMFKEVSHGK